MAKKSSSCCLIAFLVAIVLLIGTVAAGYFGGNYALKKYLGDEGEILQLGINNWGDLFNFLLGANELLKGKPEIEDENKPNQDNLNSAQNQLENSIVGYNPQTSFFDKQTLVFKTPLMLTGGQLAALIDKELDSLKDEVQIEFNITQIKLEVDPENNDYCTITMTFAISKDNLISPIEKQLGNFASLITSSLGDYVYITSVNRYVAIEGKMEVDTTYNQSNLFVGNSSKNAVNQKIVDLLVTLFGAENEDDLNAKFGNIIIEAVNNVGNVSFALVANESAVDKEISYIVFDNHNNSALIQKLAITAEINLDDYKDLDESNKNILSNIKSQANNMLTTLATTQLSETTTPTLIQVQDIIDSITQEHNSFVAAYQNDPATTNLTSYQNHINSLVALFL
ncbi:MAG TPA: hypothetical protein VIL26_07745 [Clostridia bacterium]